MSLRIALLAAVALGTMILAAFALMVTARWLGLLLDQHRRVQRLSGNGVLRLASGKRTRDCPGRN